ncbi:MAG TPA: TadE/TadG family type IV pilus assembly protein [Gemmataceae bacterium]|nr:TadE/TadG family type IV pilus assembly protein [Gemmataceae bacterium]
MVAERVRRRRPAALAVELLFALPVLLAMLLGTVEFSMLLVARQQLLVASREGARVAAQGGDATEVEQAVSLFLGASSLAGASVQSVLTDDVGEPLPSGAPVTVTVTLPTARAVPDLLAFIGFSIRGDTLIAQTVMRKE